MTETNVAEATPNVNEIEPTDTTEVPVPVALDTAEVMNYLMNISKALENICLNINNQIAGIIAKGKEAAEAAETNESIEGETNDDNN